MTRTLLALVLALAWAPRVEAHQLDEYLQAARLALSMDRVAIELDLTPGVSIAPQIFAIVDSDGNGRASPQEIERYARAVIDDLSLRVDGRPYSMTLTRAEAPSWTEIQEGTGTFRVEAFAEMPGLKQGRHRLAFENRHHTADAVYLVNALKPEDNDILIHAQSRDVLQHSIDVDVEVTTAVEPATWLSLACAGLLALVVARRRS
jgi:nickel/cobalt transporter (NicO) family protein